MNQFPHASITRWIAKLTFGLTLSVCVSINAHQDPEIAGYVEVDGGRIWYRLNGAEHLGKRPAIIVMHGGPGARTAVICLTSLCPIPTRSFFMTS